MLNFGGKTIIMPLSIAEWVALNDCKSKKIIVGFSSKSARSDCSNFFFLVIYRFEAKVYLALLLSWVLHLVHLIPYVIKSRVSNIRYWLSRVYASLMMKYLILSLAFIIFFSQEFVNQATQFNFCIVFVISYILPLFVFSYFDGNAKLRKHKAE